MTIDDSIDLLEDNFTVIDTHGHYTEEEEIQATEMAITIMRKYQKIKQILQEPCIIPEGCYPKLKKIKEVVEDGNDDN